VKKFHQENPNAPQRLAASLFLELLWSMPEQLTKMEGRQEDWVMGRRGRRAQEGGNVMMPLKTDYFSLFFSFYYAHFSLLWTSHFSSHSRALLVVMSLALLLSLGVT
jgi:hypothetical protein